MVKTKSKTSYLCLVFDNAFRGLKISPKNIQDSGLVRRFAHVVLLNTV